METLGGDVAVLASLTAVAILRRKKDWRGGELGCGEPLILLVKLSSDIPGYDAEIAMNEMELRVR